MSETRARKFAIWGTAISGGVALVLLPLAVWAGAYAVVWGMLGWAITAAIGIAGGVWLVRMHGRPDVSFLKAVTTCMLARLFFGAAGALAAALSGEATAYAYLIGLVAGYLPVQVLEMNWFWQLDRARS